MHAPLLRHFHRNIFDALSSENLKSQVSVFWETKSHTVNDFLFPVDGRLEQELEYVTRTLGEGAGTTNQILIQTAKESENGNLLNAPSLLTHLDILKEATSVSVEIFDTYVFSMLWFAFVKDLFSLSEHCHKI